MEALNEALGVMESGQRIMAARLALLAEHADPSPELAAELSGLSSRLACLAASAGQLAADAGMTAARMGQGGKEA